MKRHTHPLDAVEAQTFTQRDFALAGGTVLPELRIAYEAYGTLAADAQWGAADARLHEPPAHGGPLPRRLRTPRPR